MSHILRWTKTQAPYRAAPAAPAVTPEDLRRRIAELTSRHAALGERLTAKENPRWLACVQAVTDALNLAERDIEETDLALTGSDPARAALRWEQAQRQLERALAALTEWEEPCSS